jgi:uncharacterized protein
VVIKPGSSEGLYRPEAIAETYRELLARARRLLEPVVLDASWTEERHRACAIAVARDTSSELVELECGAPTEVTAERFRERAHAATDASDATPGVAAAMAAAAHPWPSTHVIKITTSLDVTLTRAERVVRDQLSA